MKTRRVFLLGCGFVAACWASAGQSELIAVSSTASPTYIRKLDTSGKPRVSTYVFTRGKFFESATIDDGLARTQFLDVEQLLIPSLAKQNYLPARNPDAAEMVIVVHWGSTLVYDDPMKELQAQKLGALLEEMGGESRKYRADHVSTNTPFPPEQDLAPINDILNSAEMGRDANELTIVRNAALLGYTKTLKAFARSASMLRTEEDSLRDDLRDERYFVILMAFDYQAYKAKKMQPLWIARLSIRSTGTNFATALPLLSEAGSKVFGQQIDHLSLVRGSFRSGEVNIGELRSLGLVEGADHK